MTDLGITQKHIFPVPNKYILDTELAEFCDSGINILHVNCRSLKKHFSELITLIENCSETLLAVPLSETWLKKSNEDIFQIYGYNFVSNCRCLKSSGGVGIYIDSNYNYFIREDMSISNAVIECLFVEISISMHNKILLGVVYRPPNSSIKYFNDELLNLLHIIDTSKVLFSCISGDYNIDLIKKDKHESYQIFLNNLLAHSFWPAISRPTRVTKTSATLVDNIFIKIKDADLSGAILYNDLSDHYPIVLKIDLQFKSSVQRNKIITQRVFSDRKKTKFVRELENVDWDKFILDHLEKDDPRLSYSRFLEIYEKLYNRNFPITEIIISKKLRPRKEWMTLGLAKSCLTKAKLFKKFKTFPSISNEKKYKEYRNKLNALLVKSEKQFYDSKLKDSAENLKKFWTTINSLINPNKLSHKVDIHDMLAGTILIKDKRQITEHFNNFFSQIGADLAAKIPPSETSFSSYLKNPVLNSLFLFPTNETEIINIVKKFKNKKCAGNDDLRLDIIKLTIFQIVKPLVLLINQSLQHGIVPDELKIAKVCPIFKSGSKSDFSNYRPISILPSFSKIFEKVIYNRLNSFIQKNKILNTNQFGFRPHHSTYMALIELYDKITESIEKEEYTIGIFIDLQKAFDSIDHSILLHKLQHYGIRGVALQWFTDYLKNRNQYVSLDDAKSRSQPVTFGVPQGSILGPILFILYINDMAQCIKKGHLILFADDTNMLISDKNYDVLIQNVNIELENLSLWFKANKLTLNAKKTSYMMFGKRKVLVRKNIFIDMEELLEVEDTKFLGVHIDNRLNWKRHVGVISNKIAHNLGIIFKVRYKISSYVLKIMYNILIQPYLYYCTIIWGCAYHTNLQHLQSLQNRAVRLMTFSNYRAHSNPLFSKLKILKISEIYKMQLAIYMYRSKLNDIPNSKIDNSSFFNFVNTSHDTRFASRMHIPYYRTNVRKFNIKCAGPILWNQLALYITDANSIFLFKTLLTNLFLEQYV